MTYKTLRKRYSEYRSVAVKRQKALQQKGYVNVPEVTNAKFPTLRELDSRQDFDTELYLKLKMKQLVEFLNNPLTLLSNQKDRSMFKALKTLQLHGYNIYETNYEAFGEFMDALRARSLGILFDSRDAAEFFEKKWKKDMSIDDLMKSYTKYELNEQAAQVENIRALYNGDDEKIHERSMALPGMTKKRLEEIEKYIEREHKKRK